MIVVLMGVSGAGKSSVGKSLAERQGWPFHDADDLHPATNVEKMALGEALTDADRWPWLDRVRELLARTARAGESAVVACSALKASYRRRLFDGLDGVELVYLRGEPPLIERRLAGRRGHFFDPRLLASQLATLEEPAAAHVVDIDAELERVVDAVQATLGLSLPRN